jgi:ADP-ribose pyrophosphatase YjhB (NUDIX family)
MRRALSSAAIFVRKAAWHGERLRWRLFHPVTLGARVILMRGGEVLLIRHTYREGWYFPGGGVDKGETLEEAARREAEEEAQATVGDVRLLGVYANFGEGKSDHVAVFYTGDFDVRPFEPNNEIAAREWFSLDDLPGTISPATRERLRELNEGRLPVTGTW